ncbi:MAG TPA: alpha/beta hydrolase [Vicinamibacterales bacterium]|nr:alpha/beta hydrolase [Vicinamibacterales bacterium]
MRPDAATAQFLDMLRSAGRPPAHELPLAEARANSKGASLALAGPKADVHKVEDRTIDTPAGKIRVRLFWPRPAAKDELLPIVVYFHGGGFVLCDLDTHDAIARGLCKGADAIVMNVDYGLSPEHKFPSAVDEAYAAAAWAAGHAREIGGDRRRIAVAGDSAGGNLATVVCALAKKNGTPAIAYQALLYPVVDLSGSTPFESRREFGGGEYFLSTEGMAWFNTLYFNDPAREARDVRASPLFNADLRGLPPALVVTAGCDPLRDEGKQYADRLKEAGVAVDYRCFETTIHAFMSFAAAIPAASEALAFVSGKLREGLKG